MKVSCSIKSFCPCTDKLSLFRPEEYRLNCIEIVSVESGVAKQVFDEVENVENNDEDSSGDSFDDDSDESDVEENLPRATDTVLLSNVQPDPIFSTEEPGPSSHTNHPGRDIEHKEAKNNESHLSLSNQF